MKENKENDSEINEKKIINNKESVKTNFIFNLIIQLLTYLIPLITSPYLSRVLSPNGIGTNSYVNSIVSYFTLIIAFGFTVYGTRKIALIRDDKKNYSKVFWEIFLTKLILFALATIVYLILIFTWSFGNFEYKTIFLVYILSLVATFLDITYLFQGLEKFRIISIINIVLRIAAAIGYFIFVKTQDDLFIYILISLLPTICIPIICWIIAIKYINKPDFKNLEVLKCMKEGFIFFLPTIAISIYTILDRTMLGALTDNTQVGYYEQAYKIVSLCTALINAISPIMLSRISYLIAQGDEKEVEHKIIQMSEIYALMAWPMMMGLYAVGSYFYPAFFGIEYTESIYVSYLLIPLILIIPISNQIGSAYYVPRNRNKIITVFFIVGALTNFITNWIFIPWMGARGAALTSLIAESIISGLFILFSWKHVNYKKILLVSMKPIISALFMFVFLMFLNYFVLDIYISNIIYKTIISIGVGAFIYGCSAIILKEPMVIDTIKKMFKKLKK